MSSAQWNEARRGGVTMDPFKVDAWDPLDLTGHMWDPLTGEMRNASSGLRVHVHILVDWLETDQTHIIKANLPGLKKEDVKVQVEGGVIHISGEFKKDEVDKNDKWRLLERPYGIFSRLFRLPGNVMLDQVKANMAYGVLTLTVPKTAESKPNIMTIEISGN